MREIVEGILGGNYLHENGSLDFSCAKIEHTLTPGDQVTGSFKIIGEAGTMVSGFVVSTDYRMECLTPDFSGQESEISYLFHGEGMEEGEAVKGAFRVISNQGEYSIPFALNCEYQIPNSSLGLVRNLFHFTNLAKSNWVEALNLFYSNEFEKVLSGSDTQYLACYHGLSVYPGQEQNMEEFLIHVGKKQGVEFRTETPVIEMEILPADGEYQLLEQELTIIRNGWGYTVLNIECDGDFLFVEKELLTEDDFLGNYARLPVYVDRGYLKQGMNRGRVAFFNSFVSFEVEVRIRLGTDHLWNQSELAKKKAIVAMMEQYEKFRTKKISLNTWLKETGLIVERLIALNEEDPAARLFKAQLLITQERDNEADWILSHAAELMQEQGVDDEVWAYYLYLTSLLHREEEEIGRVEAEVKRLYKQNRKSWRIAWLLLYLAEDFTDAPEKKLRFLEEQFDNGCRSFVIYLEALQVYHSNPALIKNLGQFEIQVLHYGARRDYFSLEMTQQLLELLDRNKEYSPVLCRILEKLYEKRQDSRIVQAMCTLLVKGGVFGPAALPWYERGIEAQLRITNLYEAFMMSIDPETRKGLPKAVVLYFSYQNKLDYERCAFLYDHVLENKVMYAEVYDKYLDRAREFVAQQIEKERMGRHLANLYSRLLTPEMITDQNAKIISRLVFSTRIKVTDSRIRKVIVYEMGSILGQEYPLTDGETCAPIYGNDSTLLFEDAFGNRFSQEDSVELEKYMIPGKFMTELMKYPLDCPEFDLYLIREKANGNLFDEDMAERALKLCGWKFIDPELKKHLSLLLMKLYYEQDQTDHLEEVLTTVKELPLNLSERMEVAKYLILSEDYAGAYDWMQKYGPYFMDANTLARLVSNLLADGAQEEPALLAAAGYLFRRGKANAAVMNYLACWAQGNCKELRDIWKDMREKEMGPTTPLEERILLQLLYTNAYVGEKTEIFESYYQTAGATEVARAFLIQSAYDYFVREKVTEGIVFRSILDDYKWGTPIHKVCKLAFLKYYADNPSEISGQVNEVLEVFLREMMSEKIHFGFYKNLKNQRHLLGELADKMFVEYRTRPGGLARIHYVISRENGEEQEYLAENMRDVFGGLCSKEFVLFFGESLQYYITEEFAGEETLTESGTLQCQDTDGEDVLASKFGIVNDMILSLGLQDYDTFDRELETYYYREYCGENLFKLQ